MDGELCGKKETSVIFEEKYGIYLSIKGSKKTGNEGSKGI